MTKFNIKIYLISHVDFSLLPKSPALVGRLQYPLQLLAGITGRTSMPCTHSPFASIAAQILLPFQHSHQPTIVNVSWPQCWPIERTNCLLAAAIPAWLSLGRNDSQKNFVVVQQPENAVFVGWHCESVDPMLVGCCWLPLG